MFFLDCLMKSRSVWRVNCANSLTSCCPSRNRTMYSFIYWRNFWIDHFGSFKTFELLRINCIMRYGLELLLRFVFLVMWHSLSVFFFYLNIFGCLSELVHVGVCLHSKNFGNCGFWKEEEEKRIKGSKFVPKRKAHKAVLCWVRELVYRRSYKTFSNNLWKYSGSASATSLMSAHLHSHLRQWVTGLFWPNQTWGFLERRILVSFIVFFCCVRKMCGFFFFDNKMTDSANWPWRL